MGPLIHELFFRLLETDYAQYDPEVVRLPAALTNIVEHDKRGNHPTEVLLMVAWGEKGVLDRPTLRVMRWRRQALSGSDLAHEPKKDTTMTYQTEEMPLITRPRTVLRSRHQGFHQKLCCEAASSSSRLKAALPAKKPRVEKKV